MPLPGLRDYVLRFHHDVSPNLIDVNYGVHGSIGVGFDSV